MWCDKQLVKSKEYLESCSNLLNSKESLAPEMATSAQKISDEKMLQCISYNLSNLAEQIENLKIKVEEVSTRTTTMVERIEAERKIFIVFILAILCIKFLFT